jgi:hypothetical protein
VFVLAGVVFQTGYSLRAHALQPCELAFKAVELETDGEGPLTVQYARRLFASCYLFGLSPGCTRLFDFICKPPGEWCVIGFWFRVNAMQYDAYSAAAEEAFAADISSGRNPPRMVILCGIPGCGKVRYADSSPAFCLDENTSKRWLIRLTFVCSAGCLGDMHCFVPICFLTNCLQVHARCSSWKLGLGANQSRRPGKPRRL